MLRQNSTSIADSIGLTTTKLHVEKAATAASQQEEFQKEYPANMAVDFVALFSEARIVTLLL